MRTLIARFLLAAVSIALVVNFGCQATSSTEVGSPQDTQISSMNFTIDSTYIYNTSLYARGTVVNGGTTQVTPPWYVECQFYTDSTKTFSLGGSNTQISIPLNPGQGTFWTISFYSTNVEVRNYPNFKVGSLRAVYKK